MGQVQGMIFPKQSWIDSWYTGVHWTPLLDVKDHVFYVFCSSPISWFFCRCCYFRKAHVVTNVQISEIEEGPKNPMNLMNFKNQSGKSTFSIHHFPHESFHFIFGGHNFPLCYMKNRHRLRAQISQRIVAEIEFLQSRDRGCCGGWGSRQHGPHHLKVELFADVWFSMAISGRITASCKNNPCLGKSDDHHQKCCLLVKSHDALRDFSLRLDYQHPHSVNKLEGSRRWKNQEIKKNGMPSHSSESMAK